MSELKDLKTAEYQDLVNQGGVTVVDFWAPWCGYCRRLAPAVERLEAEIGSKVTVAKADIDELPEIARQYEIDTIPTLILFQDGKEADRVVNPPSQDAVEEWLKTNQVI